MAIAIDASTPALVGASASSIQTSTFSPPAGSLLLACVHCDPGRTITITNTIAPLTWNVIYNEFPSGNGSSHARYAGLAGGAANMSVTANGSVSSDFAMKLYVITGYDTSTPIGYVSTGGGAVNTSNVMTQNIIPQVSNSLGFIVADDFTAPGTTTSPNTTLANYDSTGHIGGGSGYRLMGAAAGTEAFTLDAAGTAAAKWAWGVFEVRAAVAGPVVTNTISTHGTALARASLW